MVLYFPFRPCTSPGLGHAQYSLSTPYYGYSGVHSCQILFNPSCLFCSFKETVCINCMWPNLRGLREEKMHSYVMHEINHVKITKSLWERRNLEITLGSTFLTWIFASDVTAHNIPPHPWKYHHATIHHICTFEQQPLEKLPSNTQPADHNCYLYQHTCLSHHNFKFFIHIVLFQNDKIT